MKNKLVAGFSVVLLMVVACQTPQHLTPVAPEPAPLPLPDKCPVLQLQQSIPSRCCYVACTEKNYPGAAYQRCKDRVLSEYNCTTDQYIVIGFSNHNACRCN